MPIGNQGGIDTNAQLVPRGLLLLAPSQGNRGAVEFTWRGLELIAGNYYVLTLLVFIAATGCALVLTRRLRPERVLISRIRPERAVGPGPDAGRAHSRPASPGKAPGKASSFDFRPGVARHSSALRSD